MIDIPADEGYWRELRVGVQLLVPVAFAAGRVSVCFSAAQVNPRYSRRRRMPSTKSTLDVDVMRARYTGGSAQRIAGRREGEVALCSPWVTEGREAAAAVDCRGRGLMRAQNCEGRHVK